MGTPRAWVSTRLRRATPSIANPAAPSKAGTWRSSTSIAAHANAIQMPAANHSTKKATCHAAAAVAPGVEAGPAEVERCDRLRRRRARIATVRVDQSKAEYA